MNPFDFYAQAWTGWDDKDANDSGNPFLDPFFDTIRGQVHEFAHDAVKDYVCQGVLDEAVRQGYLSRPAADTLLPVLEVVFDRLDPCG